MNMIKVQEREVRGVTYLPNGQRYEGWVPKGEYEFIGECQLNVGFANPAYRTAWKVQHATHGIWYVGPNSVKTYVS